MRVPTYAYILVFVLLLAGNYFVYTTIFAPPVLTVHVLDVGEKGSAVLLQSPSRETILIDTGPDASILRALGSALPMWQRSVDAVILTGTKKAFVGGLPDVKSRYHVTRTYSSGSEFILGNLSLTILAPGEIKIKYGSAVFSISSSTPKGVYTF